MIQIEFSEQEKQDIYYERFHYPHPRRQKKMEALWLKSQEIPHHQISQLAGITPNTLRTYLRDYQQGGIEKLKEINFYRLRQYCPCCTNTLLRHIKHKQLYWFCPHCDQAMPIIEEQPITIQHQQIFPCI